MGQGIKKVTEDLEGDFGIKAIRVKIWEAMILELNFKVDEIIRDKELVIAAVNPNAIPISWHKVNKE